MTTQVTVRRKTGNWVRRERERLGLTTAALAAAASYSEERVRQLERLGDTAIPGVAEWRLAQVFGRMDAERDGTDAA